MVYFLTGPFGIYRDELALKLYDFIKTQKRNWRKDVFLITPADSLNEEYCKFLTQYLHKNECDVILSLESPSRDEREWFKQEFLPNKFQEIYVHSDEFMKEEYERPQSNFIHINSDDTSIILAFSSLLVELDSIKKL
jgi:adenylylsulfate kinase-like enzyme